MKRLMLIGIMFLSGSDPQASEPVMHDQSDNSVEVTINALSIAADALEQIK